MKLLPMLLIALGGCVLAAANAGSAGGAGSAVSGTGGSSVGTGAAGGSTGTGSAQLFPVQPQINPPSVSANPQIGQPFIPTTPGISAFPNNNPGELNSGNPLPMQQTSPTGLGNLSPTPGISSPGALNNGNGDNGGGLANPAH